MERGRSNRCRDGGRDIETEREMERERERRNRCRDGGRDIETEREMDGERWKEREKQQM